MTALDEQFNAADAASQHAALAAVRLENVGAQMEIMEGRRFGQMSSEELRHRAELNVQRAQAGALLAIAYKLTALRVEMVAAAVDLQESTAAIGSLTAAVDGLAAVLDRPRWWQWRRMWANHKVFATATSLSTVPPAKDAGEVYDVPAGGF